MAVLRKQRGVELMRWARGTMHERVVRAYFTGGRVLQKLAGEGFKRAGVWNVAAVAELRDALAADGWVKVKSLGKPVDTPRGE